MRPGGQGVSKGKFHCFMWVSFDHQMRRGHRREHPASCKSHKTMWDTKYHRRVISISHEKKNNGDQGRREHDQKPRSMLRQCRTTRPLHDQPVCPLCPLFSETPLRDIQTQDLVSSHSSALMPLFPWLLPNVSTPLVVLIIL